VSLRRSTFLAILGAAVAAILVAATPTLAAINNEPRPLSPDQAQALATAPAEAPSGSTTSAVDGLAVLKASTLPGADTSIEAGVSPQAAVGLVTLNQPNAVSAITPTCWANEMWHQWGTWPYQQRVTDTTYWCAVFGSHITYRTSSTTASGLLCGVGWRANALIGGGIGSGFPYFTNRASAGFSCQTAVPWITIHTSHYLDVRRTDTGATTQVGTG
jgi:hypothetical protein